MSIIEKKKVIEEGDVVLLWGGRDAMSTITTKKGATLNNKRGLFFHDELIGTQYGTKWWSKNKKGWLYAILPTPELWTKALRHRTQILYPVDMSLICTMLELRPGAVVIESGTGSGSLSTAMTRAIAPNGKLFTFEFNKDRVAAAKEDFKNNKISHLIEVTWRNVCADGFRVKDFANAVFLDLPSPWEVVESAKDALVEGGNFCSFSPCIEQVQRTCQKLADLHFTDIRNIECLMRPYEVRPNWMTVLKFDQAAKELQQQKEEQDALKNQVEDNSNVPESEVNDGSDKKRDRESFEEKSEEQKSEKEDVTAAVSSDNMEVETKKQSTNQTSKNKQIKLMREEKKVLTIRPIGNIAGHTGFLTFARKPVSSTASATSTQQTETKEEQ